LDELLVVIALDLGRMLAWFEEWLGQGDRGSQACLYLVQVMQWLEEVVSYHNLSKSVNIRVMMHNRLWEGFD
jgi:hypothetical protein